MYNVYSCQISYTRIPKKGVLAGIPCKCTFGVADEVSGKKVYDEMVQSNPDIHFSDYAFTKKR